MKNILEQLITIPSSRTDARGQLSVVGAFHTIMDLASDHAEIIGVGYGDMCARGAYWVAVRTRLRFYDRPAMGQEVRLQTWPGKAGSVKCDRFYRISQGARPVIEGRTEWVAQDFETGRILKTDAFGYPLDMAVRPERVCDVPFTRFKDDPAPENLVQTYTVGSQDIDTGRHMNNVAYVRMLMGTFTVAQIEAMDICEVEVAYRVACREGEALTIYRRQDGEGWHFLVCKADGTAAMQAVIRLKI